MVEKTSGSYGQTLKALRQEKELTQENLAELLGSSARYISFVETERSLPSRPYLLNLADALELPPIIRDHLLTNAGYAPVHSYDEFSEADRDLMLKNLKWQTNNFDPYPAVTVDRYWNILYANQAMKKMYKVFKINTELFGQERLNQIDLLLSPEGFRPYIENILDTEVFYLSRVKAASVRNPNDERYALLLERLVSYSAIWTAKNINLLKCDHKLFTYLHLKVEQVDLVFQTIRGTMAGKLDSKIEEFWMEASCPADEVADKRYREFIMQL